MRDLDMRCYLRNIDRP